MTENKETKKKQPKVAALPSEVNVNVNFNWGALASEVRNLIEEFKDKDYSTPVNVDHKVSQESLDVLLAEITNRMKAEMSPENGSSYYNDLTPFTSFVKTFAGYGLPANVIVDRISFGYTLEKLEAYIDGKKIDVKLDNDDIKRLVDVKDNDVAKHEFALELFPKYFKDILLRESFYNYKDYEDDFSKYVTPEGVEIKDVTLSEDEISATIDGVFKTGKLQAADYLATLCFDFNGYRTPKATAEQLVVKYFLHEKEVEKPNFLPTVEIYADYLRKTLDDMQETTYHDANSEWLAIYDYLNSLSIKDNKILGTITAGDRFDNMHSILLAVKYMFAKEYKVNLSDVPQAEIVLDLDSNNEPVHRSGRGRR